MLLIKNKKINTVVTDRQSELFENDDDFLKHIQKTTFGYFWDFAHENCGAIRERSNHNFTDVITSGGTGFGLMTIIVAVENKWIMRNDALKRINKILDFLITCKTIFGAYAHWYNGNTGQIIPFSKKDTGADLVETSFLIMGLMTVRQYFSDNINIVNTINKISENIQWNKFTREKDTLYWHESVDGKKQINLKIQGYNEALITYVLAASSTNYSINKSIYGSGWARHGQFKNENIFYDIFLPLGPDYGGPLFFAQYGFLGLDPRNLKDDYANYWQQNIAHTRINYQYCVHNPKRYKGYGEHCWGLSSCDNNKKYKPHSPTRDNGTICPSAAVASIPYLPTESMNAIKYFYYQLGNKIWGEYGFKDGFNLTRNWYADSYLAINQAPIILMIENYRTQLLWNLFMSCNEVKLGLKRLGFK